MRPVVEIISLSTRDAAKAIGVPPRTLQDMAKRGDAPARRIGRRLVFPLNELRQWIQNASPASTAGPSPTAGGEG